MDGSMDVSTVRKLFVFWVRHTKRNAVHTIEDVAGEPAMSHPACLEILAYP